jgi:Zn-dependent protease
MLKEVRVLGIPVYFHRDSLLLVFLLVGIISFLMMNPGPMSPRLYIVGSFIITFGVLGSIFLHEFAHSIVAKYYGISNDGIFWRAWGGQAKINEEEIREPNELFWVVVVGPLTNIVIAGVCFIIFTLSGFTVQMPYFLIAHPDLLAISDFWLLWGFIWWGLFIINMLASISNLVFILPLDGGYIVKSLVWNLLKDKRQATSIVAMLGIVQGMILVLVPYYSGYWLLSLYGWFFLVLAMGYWIYFRYLFNRWRYPETWRQLLSLRMTRGD